MVPGHGFDDAVHHLPHHTRGRATSFTLRIQWICDTSSKSTGDLSFSGRTVHRSGWTFLFAAWAASLPPISGRRARCCAKEVPQPTSPLSRLADRARFLACRQRLWSARSSCRIRMVWSAYFTWRRGCYSYFASNMARHGHRTPTGRQERSPPPLQEHIGLTVGPSLGDMGVGLCVCSVLSIFCHMSSVIVLMTLTLLAVPPRIGPHSRVTAS